MILFVLHCLMEVQEPLDVELVRPCGSQGILSVPCAILCYSIVDVTFIVLSMALFVSPVEFFLPH